MESAVVFSAPWRLFTESCALSEAGRSGQNSSNKADGSADRFFSYVLSKHGEGSLHMCDVHVLESRYWISDVDQIDSTDGGQTVAPRTLDGTLHILRVTYVRNTVLRTNIAIQTRSSAINSTRHQQWNLTVKVLTTFS